MAKTKSSAPSRTTTHPATRAGDPFVAAARGRDADTLEAQYAGLERLEEKLRHELLDDEGRQELRDRVLHIRRRLGS